MSVATISRDELKKKLDRKEKVVLLEILPEDTYRRSHLPGAKVMPMDKVQELAPKMVPDKNAEVITYCMNKLWTASEVAARDLAAMGYKNVREYAEGKQDWIAAGLPAEGTHPREPIAPKK